MKKLYGLLLVCAAVLLFFYPTFVQRKLPVPTDSLVGLYYPWFHNTPYKNFLITDPIRQQIPWRKLVVDGFKKGKIRLWNPYTFSGTSLSGNIQAGTWYPLNLLFLFLPFYLAWSILVISQPLLAGIFLFLYLRSKGLHRYVSAFSGIVWAFCGFSIAWLTWGTIVSTALWLPLLLLCIDKIRESKKQLSWTILLTLAASIAFFAGHVQVALYIFLLAGVYAVFRFSWWLVIAAVAFVVVTSVQWVPFINFLSHSARVLDTVGWLKEGWFLPWQHGIQFIAPDFFGNPTTLNYWGVWNYGEFVGYIGILPLLFALYAIWVRKDRLTRFFAISLGVVLLFLFPTPIAKLPYIFHIPFWSSLQPTRLMVLVDFCLVVLAALGLDAYLSKPKKHMFGVVGAVGLVFLGLWLFVLTNPSVDIATARRNLILPTALWVLGLFLFTGFYTKFRKKRSWLVLAVIGITVFDLFRFGWKFTPFTPVESFYPNTKTLQFLTSQTKPFRIISLDNRVLPPNVSAYFKLETAEGYDPIYDSRYEEFIAALNRNAPNIQGPFGFNRIITISDIRSPLFPLLNVKYILTLSDQAPLNTELMYHEGNTRVYWYKKAVPRQYEVAKVLYAATKQEVMNLLYSKTFIPDSMAVVEKPVQIPEGGHFEVYAESFDAGWHAFIDGKETKIYRTNYIFQGVVVPAGNHRVEFKYL